MTESNTATPDSDRPERVQDALEASVRHARNAVAEALLAARAIVDAIALAATGAPARIEPGDRSGSDLKRGLAQLAESIEGLSQRMASDRVEAPTALVGAILEALDLEIARWEQRSQIDPDARAVLRAFLGLREILWEFGLRGEPEATTPSQPSASSAGRSEDAREHTGPQDEPTRQEASRRVRRIVVERG